MTEPQTGATYDDLLAVARHAEDTGFDAFIRSDHYLTMGGDGLPGPTDARLTPPAPPRQTPPLPPPPPPANPPGPGRGRWSRRRPSGSPARWRSRSPRWTR